MTLREFAKLSGLTLPFLAKVLGISPRYMQYLVKGECIPSRKVALKIEEFSKGKVKAKDILFPKDKT